MDARAVVFLQQLHEMMEQTAGREVDEFLRQSWVSSSATVRDSIALCFAEPFSAVRAEREWLFVRSVVD